MDDLFDAVINVREVTAYKLTMPDGSFQWADNKAEIKRAAGDYAAKSGKSLVLLEWHKG